MRKNIILFLAIFLYGANLTYAWTPIENRTTILENEKVETTLDESNFTLAGNTTTDINFWKQALPEADRDAEQILVVPINGLVVPIVAFSEESEEFQKAINGKDFDYMSSLQAGVLEYPGTSKNGYGEKGNKVIFWHSSYYKEDTGRYKTHFQKIIELDVGEEIWVYQKWREGTYQRYAYSVTDSYNTPAEDSSIMKPTNISQLTLFTCTPIWGISGRWIVKAKLNRTLTFQKTETIKKYEKIIDNYVASLVRREENKVELYVTLQKIHNILTQREKEVTDPEIIYIISYFKIKVFLEIVKI